MRRLKSIDIFRGCSMAWMFLGHCLDWWLADEFAWFYAIVGSIFDPMGAAAFLFIAGVSTMISYRNRHTRADISEDYNPRMIKHEYMIRATLIFFIALLYNIPVAVSINNISWIWTWFILLTISISLFLAWPLLKTSKLFRLIIGGLLWMGNQFILAFLLPYQGQSNILGVLFHILYNSLNLDPIFSMFSFFLIGTVVGDTIFDIYQIENSENRKNAIIKKLFIPSLIFGGFLITFGVLFRFPEFFTPRTFAWVFYSLGIELVFFSILVSIEEFEIIKTEKSYKVLFYFSYYSFTIYLLHNLLYFLFLDSLNIFTIWIFIGITFILSILILKIIYQRLGAKFSLKIQIGKFASRIAVLIEEKKKIKRCTVENRDIL